jgi:hypothetical protein
MNSQSYNKRINNNLILAIKYAKFCSWCIVSFYMKANLTWLEQLSLILSISISTVQLWQLQLKLNDARYVIQISRRDFAVTLNG